MGQMSLSTVVKQRTTQVPPPTYFCLPSQSLTMTFKTSILLGPACCVVSSPHYSLSFSLSLQSFQFSNSPASPSVTSQYFHFCTQHCCVISLLCYCVTLYFVARYCIV